MSCFVVSNAHISAMLRFVAAKTHSKSLYLLESGERDSRGEWLSMLNIDHANAVGQALLQLNVDAWNYRYQQNVYEPQFEFQPKGFIPSAVGMLKLCRCYAYQVCELDDYAITPAGRMLDCMMGHAISQLPGYDDLPWDV
jgi:hypothetical protein